MSRHVKPHRWADLLAGRITGSERAGKRAAAIQTLLSTAKLNGLVALKNQQPALLSSNPEFSRRQGKQRRDLKVAGLLGIEVLKLRASKSQQALGTDTDPEGIWSTSQCCKVVTGKTVERGVAPDFPSVLVELQKA
jgi:hypothetical protein